MVTACLLLAQLTQTYEIKMLRVHSMKNVFTYFLQKGKKTH